jgi:PAS domain S-box-containing protein
MMKVVNNSEGGMVWQFNLYAIPMFLSSVFLLLFAAVAFRRQATLPAHLFILFVLSVAGMNFAYALELLSADLASMMIWLRVEYAFRYIPTLWLFFVLAHIGHENWVRPRYLIPFFAVPFIWALLAWTNDYHHLNWLTTGVEMVQGMAMFTRTYGAGFYVGLAYDYTIAAVAIGLMIVSILRAPAPDRMQIVYLVVGVIPPILGSILTTLKLTPIPHLDLLPFGYAIMCVPLGWSLFRHHLLDIMPRAYSQVIESMPDAMLVLDENRCIIHANPAAVALAGREQASDILGLSLAALFPQQYDRLDHLIRTETPFSELGIQSPIGACYFEPRLSKLLHRNGRLCGYVIVLRDVTARKTAEEIVGRYATELEARNHELDAFSHTVAHDLKSPLSNMIGFSLLLMNQSEDRLDFKTLRHDLHRIVQAGYKMTEIIDGLLLLSQLRDNLIITEQVNMDMVVRAAVERFHVDIERRHVEIEIADHLPPVCGHALWLEEVFANLVSNAIKYIGHDNPAPRISIQGFDLGGMVRYEVQDNGIGIQPEDRVRLFEMFTRFHKDETTGLGLGLSIVLRIIKKLGGNVGVESEPGTGSTFWFTLPAEAPPVAIGQPAGAAVSR